MQDIPRYTDELLEITWSLAIARGEILPLVANDPHYGPLWYYFLAGLFTLVGPGPDLPRLAALVLGAGTVVLTYAFARDVAGRWPALIAAGLLLTSGGHIIINSHTARSNSITPLLTTAALWLLYRALARRRWDPSTGASRERHADPRLLVPAAFLLGLALQTHISIIALLPGVAVAVLAQDWRLLRTPWPYLAVLAALVGYGPMVIYNLSTNFWTFRAAQDLQQHYAGGRPETVSFYVANLQALLQSLGRLLSGTIDVGDSPSRFLYGAIAAVGLGLLVRRGGLALVITALSIIVVLPYFNPRYGPILSGRYLIPLLPVAFLAIGCCVVAAARIVSRRWIGLRQKHGHVLMAIVGLSLVLYPLLPLARYYHEVLADERTNRPLHQLVDGIGAVRGTGELVALDQGLAQEDLGAGGTDMKSLQMVLGTLSIPFAVWKVTDVDVSSLDGHDSVLFVMETRKRSSLPDDLRVNLVGPEVSSASGSDHRYGLYRVSAR